MVGQAYAFSGSKLQKVLDSQAVVRPDGRSQVLPRLGQGRSMAVIITKGSWCDVCTGQLKKLSTRLPEIERLGARVVALSNQPADHNAAFLSEAGLAIEVLGAEDRLFKGIGFWMRGHETPAPGVIFLDRCGEVVGVLQGRQPGVDQDKVVLETLEKIASAPSSCGNLI